MSSPHRFLMWARHPDRLANGWRLDEVSASRGEFLLYHGSAEGRYVRVTGAVVEMGTFAGAASNIGDAAFTCLHSARFQNDYTARQKIVEARSWRPLLELVAALEAARLEHEAAEVRAEAAAERRREDRDSHDERGRRVR